MKIALAQQNYHIGNFESNRIKIIEAIQRAIDEAAELIVFSELCICGYPPRDFVEFEDFIEQCYYSIEIIKEYSENIGIILGCPMRNPEQKGKRLFNAAWFLYKKRVLGVAHKTCLPTYDVFDEYRYFEPGYQWNAIDFKGKRIALTICEDIWNLGDNPLYRTCPMDMLIQQAPDFMINISASPFDYDHDEDREEIVRRNVVKYEMPMFYCNAIGSQTEIVFDGGSLVLDAQGRTVRELKFFEEDFAVVELPGTCGRHTDDLSAGVLPPNRPLDSVMRVARINDSDKIIEYLTADENIRQIHQALLLGVRDYFGKMGFGKAILGSSGGIDSAVTLSLASEALGAQNVRAVLMPSPFSTAHSVEDAQLLSQRLGNPHDIVPIRELYDSFLSTLKPIFADSSFGIAEENIQSRTRGNLLMAMANKFGYILLNTSNKSELATGYGTLYGDMAGGLSVLGDLYKTQVYALAKHINRRSEIIPANILSKEPSAELRPDQKDTDSLPPYEILDKVLYQYIEKRQGPREIVSMGVAKQLVDKILKLVNGNEYKRNQFCPIIRVSCKAFGVGRRVPIVAKYLS